MASIEDLLRDIADALRDNTDTLKAMTAAAKKATGGAASTSSRSSSKDEDGDGEGDKPASGRKPRTTKPKVPSAKDMSAATTKFLEVDDEDEYEKRKAIIKKIVGKFDSGKMSEIPEEDRAEAMELLQIAIDGGNPFPARRSRDDDDVA